MKEPTPEVRSFLACRRIAVAVLLAGAGLVALTLASPWMARAGDSGRLAVAEELMPYVEFLETGTRDPVDYVLGLFETHDLVILCERQHPETTQYELISELVADPRFADRAGVVFTELGARNLQGELDAIMATAGLQRDAVGHRLVPIFRNMSIHPAWPGTNFFDFLRDVYELNQRRTADRRIEIRFVDLPIEWAEIRTPEAYSHLWATEVSRRDRLMAEAVIDGVGALEEKRGKPVKALVIMNYRHAFNDFSFADGSRGDNVGRYLFEAFPGRVANVMLNSLALLPGTTDTDPVTEPIQKGKWDAAFRAAGIDEAGFDFAGSPFGMDPFDYFAFRPHSVRYQDVFRGFVFYRPLSEQRLQSGIPGMFEGDFEKEWRRRIAVTGRAFHEADLEAMVAKATHPVIEPLENLAEIEAMIVRWLEPADAR